MQDLISKQELLNVTITSLALKLTELTDRVSSLEKQPSIEEVRKDLAHLGSEMKGSIEEMQKSIDNLKQKAAEDRAASSATNDSKPSPPQQLQSSSMSASVVPPNNNQ